MLLRLVLNTIAVIVTSFLLQGVHLKGFLYAFIVAVVLAFLNSILKPILVFLTIPITILTFGLFLLVLNAAMILLASNFVPGFYVEGFGWALGFSIILSILNSLLGANDHK